MPDQSAQAIVEKFIDAWNRMDFEAIVEALDRNILYHNMPMAPVTGREAVREYLRSAWRFEAVDWQTINIASAGNTVLTERVDNFVINGAPVSLPVMGVFEIVDDKIAAWRDYFDLAGYKAQLAVATGNAE